MAQEPVNSIWNCKGETCSGQCDKKSGLCQYLIATADAVTLSTADVMRTVDGGSTWVNCAAVPFAADEDIVTGVCFQKDKTTTRILVARSVEATPTNPLEVAYSDDDGATWTNVDVEASGTRYVVGSDGLFLLDPKHVWIVSSGGYIFFTSDGGASWTEQDGGTLTTGDYNAVKFSSSDSGYAVAAAGVVAKTDDGGITWSACTVITGTPSVLSVEVFGKDIAIVGDDNGAMWKTWDGGVTWTQLYSGSTAINSIKFYNDFTGFAVDSGTVLKTKNGGEDWETVSGLPAVTEFNDIVVCDDNTAYVVGEDSANDGILFKLA